MSYAGFAEFDATVQETNTWLNDIAIAMACPKRVAYHALRGVLFALRDRLPIEELFDLSAQFPVLMRGILFEGYSPTGKPEKIHAKEFLNRVEDELDKVGGADPEVAVQSVLETITMHVDRGELRQVHHALPEDLRTLWPRLAIH